MSYGRFYNVRGGKNPSDLDLILVYKDGEETELVSTRIMPLSLGFDSEAAQLFSERVKKFAEIRKAGKANVLSQKSHIRNQNFDVSLHIMNRATLHYCTIGGTLVDLRSGESVDRRVADYKPQPFKHQIMEQRDFLGGKHEFCANEVPLVDGVGENEVISNIPAYAIRNGMFIPGMYMNLISPRFELEPFSAVSAALLVQACSHMMHGLQAEYRKSNSSASILKSHPRYELFSPKLKEKYE